MQHRMISEVFLGFFLAANHFVKTPKVEFRDGYIGLNESTYVKQSVCPCLFFYQIVHGSYDMVPLTTVLIGVSDLYLLLE